MATNSNISALLNWEGSMVLLFVMAFDVGAMVLSIARWLEDCLDYDKDVAKAMYYTRFLQIKRAFKLCNNDKAKKRKDEGYDPAYKYDLVYKALVDNQLGNVPSRA